MGADCCNENKSETNIVEQTSGASTGAATTTTQSSAGGASEVQKS